MDKTDNKDFFEINVSRIDGKSITLEKYKGNVIIIVNTASECGLTPQFEGLEALYQKYKDQGLVILGFPCNQFGGQEPGSEQEIISGCLLNYGVTFPMFSKIEVNGPNAHPLFDYLKSECKGLLGSKIKWNFTKFIIDQQGYPIKRFSPTYLPKSLESHIIKSLNIRT